MKEVWRPIAGYEGLYEVSNLGRVRRLHKATPPRILNPELNHRGYLRVCLYRDGKSKKFSVHRLVALAFIPNPENKPEVNHDNGIKTDCRVENLLWATGSENQLHAVKNRLRKILQGEDSYQSKLTNEQVRYIRDNPDNLSIAELAEMFGVSQAVICAIQLYKTYKTAGGKKRNKRGIPNETREQIRREYVHGSHDFGVCALAEKYGVHPSTISRIVKETHS